MFREPHESEMADAMIEAIKCAYANVTNALSMHNNPPKCQIRVYDLETKLSRNTKSNSILTENTPRS
jgi:hypothetical protein